MGPAKVAEAWKKLYFNAKLSNPDEKTQAACRLAVYKYLCLNGTSREGTYSGLITMSNGESFPSSVIPLATGKMQIRKFMRGNMVESYESLKSSRAMDTENRFIAKQANLGISAECAFAVADWMTDCPLFTPAESAAHGKSLVHGLERSRRARGDQTLEGVEKARVDEGLRAQGGVSANSNEF
jgi:hypothetical protein